MTAPRPTFWPKRRRDAAALGHGYYRTGRPCCHGHVAERETVSGGCMACKRLSIIAGRKRIREALRLARAASGGRAPTRRK